MMACIALASTIDEVKVNKNLSVTNLVNFCQCFNQHNYHQHILVNASQILLGNCSSTKKDYFLQAFSASASGSQTKLYKVKKGIDT